MWQVDTLRSELELTWSDNANLRHESQLVMANVNRWITEQKYEQCYVLLKASCQCFLVDSVCVQYT